MRDYRTGILARIKVYSVVSIIHLKLGHNDPCEQIEVHTVRSHKYTVSFSLWCDGSEAPAGLSSIHAMKQRHFSAHTFLHTLRSKW